MTIDSEIIGHFRAMGRLTNALVATEEQVEVLQQEILRLTKERDALLEEVREQDKEPDEHP